METIIKQSADGIVLRGYNKLDTTQGKVFINNHEITDIDTFFKVAEENTRLLEQVKKQKEAIDKIQIIITNMQSELAEIKPYHSYVVDGNIIRNMTKNIEDILKEVSE